MAGRMIAVQEEERGRIARELHDDISQRLTLIILRVESLRDGLGGSRSSIQAQLADLVRDLKALASDVHSVSHNLHPSIVRDLGLVAATRAECKEFSKLHGIDIEFRCRGVLKAVPEHTALSLFRITQEALRNIAKHAEARQAHVHLESAAGEVRLRIEDSGIGFNPNRLRGEGGLGLTSMRERARLARGTLVVRSSPGSGTVIEVVVPASSVSASR